MVQSRKQKRTSLTADETVVLYPTFGHLVEQGQTWRIAVQGTVYDAEQVGMSKRLLVRLLRRVMKASPGDLESETFRQRIRCFAAATERGRRISVQCGDRAHELRKASNRSGHFSGAIRVSTDAANELSSNGTGGGDWIRLDPVVPDRGSGHFHCQAQLLADQGVSVISDIDDTIKHTGVLSRRELLANTFLNEFRSIEGMADLYRRWQSQGAAFHYVSSSPWQLFLPLFELCESAGFPAGSFHLRAFRLRDHMIRRLLLIRRRGKAKIINKLVETFPQRKFILVGDSGEKDPEIYCQVARRFPERVAAILIRDLPQNRLDAQRLSRAARGIDLELVQTFQESSELAPDLPTRTRLGT